MRVLIISVIICFLSCKHKKEQINNLNHISNCLVLEIDKTTLIINDVKSIYDSTNVNIDYDIKKQKNKLTITPAFLESDLLDNKHVEIIGEEFSNVEILFEYDAIFYGEEKKKYMLGFKRDTLINIKVINRHFTIPNSNELKKQVSNKFEFSKVLEKSYLINYRYNEDIIKNTDMIGNSDYNNANEFFKKQQSDFKSLDQLLTEIDYYKITLKLTNNGKKEILIVYDRGFTPSELTPNKIIPNTLFADYYNLKSELLSINSKEYEVNVLEKKNLKEIDNVQHNSNPIVILEKSGKDFIKLNENNKIIFKYNDNCPADGFIGIVTKDNYFTIQQIFCKDFLFVTSYTTFKIDEKTNHIELHKYGQEYADRSNPDKDIPTKIWTNKDFGNIKFEDVSEDFIINLIQNNPKK
ncbi:hypothetical protein FLGE108171_15160 [Flavobacterium gelidilacus]|uniref:hypothetical protein n=1 Tax=Flavobacterium gelidilacus TaxID=206041 RepID=UPI0004205AC5|nr:hypothetical protein [Flavobacterium gelidilacus]